MKKISTTVIIIATIIWASCSGEKAEAEETVTLPEVQATQQSAEELPPAFTTTEEDMPDLNTAKTNQTQQTAELNPPHGQPGHRCDIEVGAPLNSAPTQISPTPKTTITPQQPKTAAGTNPPHGQPGHRCDIAVGAPLN